MIGIFNTPKCGSGSNKLMGLGDGRHGSKYLNFAHQGMDMMYVERKKRLHWG